MMETVQTMLLLPSGIFLYGLYSIPDLASHYSLSYDVRVTIWNAIPLLGGTVAFVVQTFYAYRLCILAHSWAIMILVVLLALVQFVLGIIDACNITGLAAIYLPVYSPIIWASFVIVCDLVIAIAMTYFLLHNDTGWKNTHTLLVKLVHLVVETGTVTMLIAAAYLILQLLPAGSPLHISQLLFGAMPLLAFILGKVYSNAMMVNFNHCLQILGGRNGTQIVGFTMASSQLLLPDSTVTSNEILGDC